MGSVALVYDPVQPAAGLHVRGAITQVASQDDAIPQNVRDDTAALTAPLIDERATGSRPAALRRSLGDIRGPLPGQRGQRRPRNRGSAGLGGAAGIQLQDTIVDAVKEQAGAFLIAAQRIRQLTMGVTAASSLWIDACRRSRCAACSSTAPRCAGS